MTVNENTYKHIEGLVKHLNNEFDVEFIDGKSLGIPFKYFLRIKHRGTVYKIEFSRDIIDDFDIALSKRKNTNYFYGLEGKIKFDIYIELGEKGLFPELCVSDEIINEKRDWLRRYRTNLNFDGKMTAILSDGLQYLINSFDSLLQQHESLPLEDIRNHTKYVEKLYKFYQKNNHLNYGGVEIENLQYLKAAAVAKIIHLEHQKQKTPITRIAQALNEEIFYIVEELRREPFLDIQLPDFINTFKEVYLMSVNSTPVDPIDSGKQIIVDDDNLMEFEPKKDERFDIAFSLAHEQHGYVDDVFKMIKKKAPHLNVFYYRDKGQEISLWGRNMVPYLQTVYRDLSGHVVIFVSSDYVLKRWARHEWRSIQEAILDREEEYLLPARFDDTKLPGLHETISYVDLSTKSPETFAEMILIKISSMTNNI